MRGATMTEGERCMLQNISIHAPLAGCDWRSTATTRTTTAFQSTHPLRGATAYCSRCGEVLLISIHAPLAGCDQDLRALRRYDDDFNPRTPCGVRHGDDPQDGAQVYDFNPRTPCGVRRGGAGRWRLTCGFQSTHPLRGATKSLGHRGNLLFYFNPRTPCGVRR